MQDAVHRRSEVPRGFIAGAASAVALTILAAGWFHAAGLPTRDADPPLARERLLRFEDMADGRIRVSDAASGLLVQTIEGEAGFARGTLRSLMRERRRRGADLLQPLALKAYEGGRLTLADPSTGQRIDLEAFGSSNAAVFARMLNSTGETR